MDENGFPPFYFKPGDPTLGIYELVLAEVAKITGDRFTAVFVPQIRKFKLFDANEVDVEPGVNPDWRKSAQGISAYSIAFANSEDVLIHHKDDKRAYESVKDLQGKTLGCVVGFVYPQIEKDLSSEAIHRDDSKDKEMMIQKLLKRRVDVIILPRPFAEYWQKLNTKDYQLVIGGAVDSKPIMFRFHVKKKDALPRFDKALRQVIDSGKIRAIYAGFR